MRLGRGQQVGVPVRVLQALAGQRGPAGGGAEHEAAAHLVADAQKPSPVRWNPNIE